mgnify:FL=1|tara:strand:+ start:708 stop:1424 length:717 start_codon:yes stop_codon:yes gene_type:complete
MCEFKRLGNVLDSNSPKIGTQIASIVFVNVRRVVIHMHINNDNCSNFYVKHLVILLLLTTLASTTLANEQCTGQNVFSGSCKQPKPKNILENSLKKYDFSMTTLYYSGSILHNTSQINKIVSPVETTNAETVETVNDELTLTSALDPKENQLYNEFSRKFRQFDPEGRKKIQKCLRYGSYRGEVDGLWGNQTFDSISDFKGTTGFGKADAEENLFLKIKSILSTEKACYKLVTSIFQL